MNTTLRIKQMLHPRFRRRKPFKNKYEPKTVPYSYQSAKLVFDDYIYMWQRSGTNEYLLSKEEPTKEPVWIKLGKYKSWRNE